MIRYEYKVVPAPDKSLKTKGIKANADRFAHTLETLMNEVGADGWEYVRADTLPVTERAGLTSSQTVYRNVLVFRRPLEEEVAEPTPEPALIEAQPEPEPTDLIEEDSTPNLDTPEAVEEETVTTDRG